MTVIGLRPGFGKKTLEATGMIVILRIANEDITRKRPNPHNERSLSQHIQTVIPAEPKATAIPSTQRTITLAGTGRKAAAAAVKKCLTAVEAKVAVEKTPKPTETIHLMGIANRDTNRRYHYRSP